MSLFSSHEVISTNSNWILAESTESSLQISSAYKHRHNNNNEYLLEETWAGTKTVLNVQYISNLIWNDLPVDNVEWPRQFSQNNIDNTRIELQATFDSCLQYPYSFFRKLRVLLEDGLKLRLLETKARAMTFNIHLMRKIQYTFDIDKIIR